MRIISAKILDSTHLELTQPIPDRPGDYIQISIPENTDEDSLWREAAKKHFIEAYDSQDSIYDEL